MLRHVFAILICCAGAAQAGVIVPAGGSPASVAVFDRYELVFHVDQKYDNPYNPDEVKIDALVTLPGGKMQTMPCFWMVPVKDGKRVPDQGAWHLRYAPVETGTHTIVIKLIDKSGTSQSSPVTFNATAARDPRGFVRLDKANSQFARFDNGAPYYPIGMNVPVDQALDCFNWYRYWLSTFNGRGLEWAQSDNADWKDYEGLGRYSQVAADLLDQAVATAEKRGSYMQITLQYHEQVLDGPGDDQKFDGVEKWGDPGSPFFKGNGGPLEKAAEWHGSPVVREYCKKQYRYIVARWGYSTHILGWELFNETDYSAATRNGKMKDVASWHDEMSRYFKQIDPYQHLVLTSISDPFWTEMYDMLDKLPALDMVQFHIYSNVIRDRQVPEANKFKRYAKPTWMAEFGVSDHPERDTEGRHLRRAYWLGMMNACPAEYWDSGYGMKPQFKPMFETLVSFFKDVDLVKDTAGVPRHLEITTDAQSDEPIAIYPALAQFGSTPATAELVIRRDGTVQNGDQIPRYLYGTEHRDKSKPLRFKMDFAAASKLTMHLKASDKPVTIEIAAGPAEMKKLMLRSEAQDVTVSVPAGPQAVTLKNGDAGSAELEKMTIQTPRSPLAGIGYVGKQSAIGYVYDAALDDFSSRPATKYVNVVVHLPGLEKGEYQATLRDPKDGTVDVAPVKFDVGGATLTIPSLTADMAFSIKPFRKGTE